jgi:hypothetical protein
MSGAVAEAFALAEKAGAAIASKFGGKHRVLVVLGSG